MGSLEDNLITGEAVVFRGRRHWIVLFWPVVLTVLIAGPGLFMVYEGAFAKQPNMEWLAYAGIATLCIAAIFLVRGVWRRKAVVFAVTNRRIIVSKGVVERKTEEIVLKNIESVLVDQGLLGRMLDYGTVTVRGTGTTFEPFSHVAHAMELRRQVQEQIAGTR